MTSLAPPDFIPRATARLDAPRKAPMRVDQHPGIVLHCTGGVRPISTQQAMRRWLYCQQYHQADPEWITNPDGKLVNVGGRGWSDIGYHFGITPDGFVLVGRGWDVLGAHAKGRNRWLGVVVLGRGEEITKAEQHAIAWLREIHLERGGGEAIEPHNAFSRKKCPGPAVTAWLRNLGPAGPRLEGGA